MNSPVTYSLKLNNDSSNEYYANISKLADKVLSIMDTNFRSLVEPFIDYISQNECEEVRSIEEYELELLSIGVLWGEYFNSAIVLKNSTSTLLSWFAEQRKKGHLSKVFSDKIRGILETMFLLKTGNELKKPDSAKFNFKKLIKWLSASGDFIYYVKRLKQWEEYFSIQENQRVYQCICIAKETAEWFEKKSIDFIGCYTKNVEKFLKEDYLNYKWREDVVYCGASRVQYHLNMVGAEILNRVFKGRFLETKEKWVLLPACMRANYDKDCKALETQNGYKCMQCTSTCNVNKLTQLGSKYGFKVLIIPHESTPFTKTKIESGKIGIIGIACVLNLIQGGWKAIELGFVPQCVLLEYSGCKAHWTKTGISTEINIEKLIYTLGVKPK